MFMHIEDDSGADDALIDDDLPFGIVLLLHRSLSELEEFLPRCLHGCGIGSIVEEGVDIGMAELVDWQG